jgi:hypothetical protein
MRLTVPSQIEGPPSPQYRAESAAVTQVEDPEHGHFSATGVRDTTDLLIELLVFQAEAHT